MNKRILFSVALLGSVAGIAHAAEPIGYNHDIRPILSDNCFKCHGPDSAARKAGLRLDKREVAIEAGAIVPGQPDKSE
ncbi:MAG TPA: c-type cytochrome domain-containing protein, partial [Gemmataceae bacterium]|nr:c-type cytochrome domain-containing protein [Gemmataceae bacterium]